MSGQTVAVPKDDKAPGAISSGSQTQKKKVLIVEDEATL